MTFRISNCSEKKIRQIIILFICMAGVLFPTRITFALMPPHYTEIGPVPGGNLAGDTITITGYSLAYAESPLIVDINTGEMLKARIDIKVEMVGSGLKMKDPPLGTIQEHSIMTIVLPPIQVNHRIEMKFLDETFTWTKTESGLESEMEFKEGSK